MKKTSLVKKSTEFTAMPKDSLEVHMESKIDLKRKPSKLVTAKNSLELLRESKLRIDTVNGICPTKESQKQKPIISCTKSRCNEKCQQGKDNLEIEEARDEDKYTKKNSAERSIKLSRIEVFKVDNSSREINVSINSIPTVYDTGSATFSTDLTHMYKEEPKVKKNSKSKSLLNVIKAKKLLCNIFHIQVSFLIRHIL